jgi:hypothetical protein
VERHLLPRFKLIAVAGVAAAPPRRPSAPRGRGGKDPAAGRGLLRILGHPPWRPATALGVLVCVALALVSAYRGDHVPAGAWAAGAYALVGVGTVAFGELWAAQWLLRVPAAAAVGLVPLVAFSGWWQGLEWGWQPPGFGLAALVLLGVSLGYLTVEARNHGLGGRTAVLRAAVATTMAAVHCLLVSLVGLVLVAVAFAPGEDSLAAVWRGEAGEPSAVLLLSAAWCLAVGVFSQILWDDRPITAPLAHLRWRESP